MEDNFWEANLSRGCSPWGIYDQIIMPRAGKFSLGGANEYYPEVCFVWCLVIFVIVMGFGKAEVGDA